MWRGFFLEFHLRAYRLAHRSVVFGSAAFVAVVFYDEGASDTVTLMSLILFPDRGFLAQFVFQPSSSLSQFCR